MLKFILILTSAVVVACACSCKSSQPYVTPRNYMNGRSSICPGCEYTFEYPRGFDYVNVDYNYGQMVGQVFIQNDHSIAECSYSRTCRMTVNLNANYSLKTIIFRPVSNKMEATYGSHMMNFQSYHQGDLPFELNSQNEQFAVLKEGTEYMIPVGNLLNIDMSFNFPMNLQIFDSNDTLLYSQNSREVFATVETYSTPAVRIAIQSNITTPVTALWFQAYSANQFDDNLNINNSNGKINGALGLSILSFLVILLFFSREIYYKMKNFVSPVPYEHISGYTKF